MNTHPNVTVGCLVLPEFIDEGELPRDGTYHLGEPVRPQLVGNFVDTWSNDDGIKEFTVLLQDNRIVTVRGSGLKHVHSAVNPNDEGSYAVLAAGTDREVVIAFFPVRAVTGIFSGEMRAPRESA